MAIELSVLLEVDLGEPIRQLRVVPVTMHDDDPGPLLCVHSAHPNVDPYPEYFTFPEDTLTFTLVTQSGDVAWSRDLGPGIVPGIWFCPVYPFDLDGDGIEEVWYVDTADPEHPLTRTGHRLARLDPLTGERTGMWRWPQYPRERLSNAYRNFIFGGHVEDDPVLVTAQGTYGEMRLQAWTPTLDRRWTYAISADAPGARGSHMCPVLDIDGDGADEVLWGERVLSLADGTERFCADRDTWAGHSDIVVPTYHHGSDTWSIYTCRETQGGAGPRVVLFDDRGNRRWSALETGHMHTGWVARLGSDGSRIAMAGRGKDGPHEAMEEFTWELADGTPASLEYPVYSTLPVDLDGDGVHELVYREFDRAGRVVDGSGAVIGETDPTLATHQPARLLDRPGEQVVTYTEDGRIRIWGDANARERRLARRRIAHPYYRKARRLSAVGYNWQNVAGL